MNKIAIAMVASVLALNPSKSIKQDNFPKTKKGKEMTITVRVPPERTVTPLKP
jgi:hypothetical protein